MSTIPCRWRTARRQRSSARRTISFSLQRPDGVWVGELLVDSTLISDVVAFMHWSGEVDFNKQSRCVKHLLDRQLPDGGWNTYYRGNTSELNAHTEGLAHFCSGSSLVSRLDDDRMKRAHATIVRLGGIPKANTYTKLFLALFDQFPVAKHLPIIPSEIILLPNWLYFNIYEMSSWSRAMVVPLSIINHFKPTRNLPPEKAAARTSFLTAPSIRTSACRSTRSRSRGKNFFLCVERGAEVLRFAAVQAVPQRGA